MASHPSSTEYSNTIGYSTGVAAAVMLSLIGLFVLTGFWSRAYWHQKQGRAEDLYTEGRKFEEENKLGEALERYRAASTIDRGNATYRQSLALTLVNLNRFTEAETYVRQVLERDPTHGLANLMMGRIRGETGAPDQAISYYQRAIYGSWSGEDARKRRIEARLELADYLGQINRKKQRISEILAVLDDANGDVTLRKHIADMLFESGDPSESATVYRELVKEDSKDAESQAGLGRAEFELTDYRSARTAYWNALRWEPDNQNYRERLNIINDILSLDPMQARISERERAFRSRRLIERGLAVVTQCAPDLEKMPEATKSLVEKAQKQLKDRQSYQADSLENNLNLAELLWAASGPLCGSPKDRDQALSLVIGGLEKQ